MLRPRPASWTQGLFPTGLELGRGELELRSPLPGGLPTRLKVRVGAVKPLRLPRSRGSRRYKPQAAHFSCALPGSGKPHVGLGHIDLHDDLQFFAEGQAASGAGIWEASSLVGTLVSRPHARPRIIRDPQRRFRFAKGMLHVGSGWTRAGPKKPSGVVWGRTCLRPQFAEDLVSV